MITCAPEYNPTRLWKEFDLDIDCRLRAVLLDLEREIWRRHDKDVTINCLIRTREENTAAGGSKYSAHLDGRAVDLRVWDYNSNIKKAICEYLYNTWGRDFLYVRWSDHGTGEHIHINIRYKFKEVRTV